MNKSEALELVEFMRIAVPSFLKSTAPQDIAKTVDVWHGFLSPYPVSVVRHAVAECVREKPFAPAIHDVVTKVEEVLNPERATASDAWNVLKSAAQRASVVTIEEFESLPYEVQRFCGDIGGLRDLGRSNLETLNTVTRSNFMKTYEGMRRGRETLERMPPDVRSLVDGLKFAPQAPCSELLEGEWENKRVSTMAMLETGSKEET